MNQCRKFKITTYRLFFHCRWVCLSVLIFSIIFTILVTIPGISFIQPYKIYIFIPASILGGIALISGLLFWAWYFPKFRYLAYGAAWLAAKIRTLWKSNPFRIFLVLAISTTLWGLRQQLYINNPTPFYWQKKPTFDFWAEVLKLSSIMEILLLSLLLFTIWQMYRYRKRIVISDFENFTGNKEYDTAIKGIAALIINEMSRVSNLLTTIDEIQPGSKNGVINPTVDAHELGSELEEIFGTGTAVTVAKTINIPIRPIYVFFRKKLHGPVLTGGVHFKGSTPIITACLKGGKYSRSWRISSEDIKSNTPIPSSFTDLLVKMTEQLVYHTIAYIFQDITPRWEAMKYYTDGLWLFRETSRTEEKRQVNLIEAKQAFSMALRNDKNFIQSYYNFGIVYRELENDDAAATAFREVLSKQPGNCHCYYQLAILNYNKKEYLDAQWYCEQAIVTCPAAPQYWNLMGVILYYQWQEKYKEAELEKSTDKEDAYPTITDFKTFQPIPQEVYIYFEIAIKLSWQDLCKSIIKKDKINIKKQISKLNIRNLAVTHSKKKQKPSRCLFKQALFLNPDDSELFFEEGKCLFRCENYEEAYLAFRRVFEEDKEIDDPFSFWAFYMNTSAQMYDKYKNPKQNKEEQEREAYLEVATKSYRFFLYSAANIIIEPEFDEHSPDEIELNEELVCEALKLIQGDPEPHENKLLIQAIYDSQKKQFPDSQWIEKQLSSPPLPLSKRTEPQHHNFFTWLEIQKKFHYAASIINQEKPLPKYLKKAKALLLDVFQKQINDDQDQEDIKYQFGPQSSKILLYLVKACFQLKAYGEALFYARKAVRLSPYDSEIRYHLGRIHDRLENYPQSIAEFKISFNLGLSSPNMLIKIGETYLNQGRSLHDFQQRIEAFHSALETLSQARTIMADKSYEDPDDHIGYDDYLKGSNDPMDDCDHIKTPDNQADDYNNAAPPNCGKNYLCLWTEIHFHLGNVYYELLEYDAAISHLNTVKETAKLLNNLSYSIPVIMNLGEFYLHIKDFNEAEATYTDALAQINEYRSNDLQEGENQVTSEMDNLECELRLCQIQLERAVSLKEKNFSKRNQLDFLLDKKSLPSLMAITKVTERNRLIALYYQCLGLMHQIQGQKNEAERNFELSLTYQSDSRTYLQLAQFYLQTLSEGTPSIIDPHIIFKIRRTALLCRQHDLRHEYTKEIDTILDYLDSLNKKGASLQT